ncbi:MAG: molecular chaperone DnaJ [Acetobacter sp.]|nr:molecular chaperone DnaJ [Acetobacter sp.]
MVTRLDYYEILEVSKTASADEIKKSYRKLAMKYHPDRNQGNKEAEAKFKDINQAYDILKDEQKRAAYDKFGHAAFEGGAGGASGFDFSNFDFGGFGSGLGEIFEQMFGDTMGRRRGEKSGGSNVQAYIEITLEEAFTGVQKDISVKSRVACQACSGTGSKSGSDGVQTCPSCHGAGKVRVQQGFFLVERSCPSCHGKGHTVKDPCSTCHGTGTVEQERVVAVQIPAGIENNMSFRKLGEGDAGANGRPAGDLYVHVSIKEHNLFQRDGANVYCRIPLRMAQAALGTEIDLPIVDGSCVRMKIPSGTQTGSRFSLRGKGFTVLNSSARGDMYIDVTVETPQHLTKRQRELLEEFEKEAGEDSKHSPEHASWFQRIQSFFKGS